MGDITLSRVPKTREEQWRRVPRSKSLSADANTADYDPDTVMVTIVTVIVVAARRAPRHVGNAAGRQWPSYHGLRRVSGNDDTGNLRRLDRIRHCGKHHGNCAD
jgi:hypothetical protein